MNQQPTKNTRRVLWEIWDLDCDLLPYITSLLLLHSVADLI